MGMMMSDSVPVYKVVLIGDANVGKTSLVRRYCENSFREARVETIGIDFQSQTVQLNEEETVCLVIWDVAGQERFKGFRDQYYTGALAVALVYDVTHSESFHNLSVWQKEVERAIPGVPALVIGNKSDLDLVVPPLEASEWASACGYPLLLVSAKTGENVESLFLQLAEMAHSHLQDLETFHSPFL